eukprot:2606682-Pyramimonas_sp.AAC.1
MRPLPGDPRSSWDSCPPARGQLRRGQGHVAPVDGRDEVHRVPVGQHGVLHRRWRSEAQGRPIRQVP